MMMSFTPRKITLNLQDNTQWELYSAISNVEDSIEWINEDLFQGNITQQEYDIRLEHHEETLGYLRNIQIDLTQLNK